MAIVNFVIPPALDMQVKATIKKRGFASKAEFFRMAARKYLSDLNGYEKARTIGVNQPRS